MHACTIAQTLEHLNLSLHLCDGKADIRLRMALLTYCSYRLGAQDPDMIDRRRGIVLLKKLIHI